jgi:hypothetical protein
MYVKNDASSRPRRLSATNVRGFTFDSEFHIVTYETALSLQSN